MNNMFGSVAVGVGMTTLMISGVVVGEEDKASIKKLIKTSLAHGFVLVTIVSVILFIFAPLFVSFYVQNSPETAALAVASVRFFCISMPLHATIGVFINYLQGSRNTLRAHILTLFNELVFIVAAAFALSPVFSVNGVWASFPVGKVLTILLLILMSGFAVLFPAALFAGISYDAIAAVLLVMLTIALAVLYFAENDRKGGDA